MRGLLCHAATWSMKIGITPAHAGLTVSNAYSFERKRDHPRACGAYGVLSLEVVKVSGSPPRMRGLHADQYGTGRAAGITPAHAGLTIQRLTMKGKHRDHPRACGAYENTGIKHMVLAGSPPRMRGLHGGGGGSAVLPGITPAHAGLTHRPHS